MSRTVSCLPEVTEVRMFCDVLFFYEWRGSNLGVCRFLYKNGFLKQMCDVVWLFGAWRPIAPEGARRGAFLIGELA